jgi:hypothetical protein
MSHCGAAASGMPRSRPARAVTSPHRGCSNPSRAPGGGRGGGARSGRLVRRDLAQHRRADLPSLSVLVIDVASAHRSRPHRRRAARCPRPPPGGERRASALRSTRRWSWWKAPRSTRSATTTWPSSPTPSARGGGGVPLQRWHHRSEAGRLARPPRLLQVGMAADKTGALAPIAEPLELDQEQHDAIRDVFVVPGGCTIVRADLLDALDGFDPEIVGLGDDLDLCWRAHVLGARVVVAPVTRVRHLEAMGLRREIDDRRRRPLATGSGHRSSATAGGIGCGSCPRRCSSRSSSRSTRCSPAIPRRRATCSPRGRGTCGASGASETAASSSAHIGR